MDINGLQRILNATPIQLRLLASKLSPGNAYAFHLDAGPDFDPSSMTAWLRPLDAGFELRLGAPIQYTGGDPTLFAMAQTGWHRSADLDQLVSFLRRHFAPPTVSPLPPVSAPPHGQYAPHPSDSSLPTDASFSQR